MATFDGPKVKVRNYNPQDSVYGFGKTLTQWIRDMRKNKICLVNRLGESEQDAKKVNWH